MKRYWIIHRFLYTFIFCVVITTVEALFFVYPLVNQKAGIYNEQSVYKNSDIDFIAPEPSFEQVSEIVGNSGIECVFPFYLTKTEVNTNGKTRTTTVLLSDQYENIDMTMYNEKRLIKKSDTKYENSVMVDWQFCKDTSASIGDEIEFSIAGEKRKYNICAIYETNSIYDGGAILAIINDDLKNEIVEQSKNNGYSGMYIKANDYNLCKSFLTTEYRPLGRLKDKSEFDDEDQYLVHYHAIMDTAYANEITDFTVKEKDIDSSSNIYLVYVGGVIIFVLLICFNILMARRGCEKNYFKKHCIPVGKNVKPYYRISVELECLFSIITYALALGYKYIFSKEYISKKSIGCYIFIIPIIILISEVISFVKNNLMINAAIKENNKLKMYDAIKEKNNID